MQTWQDYKHRVIDDQLVVACRALNDWFGTEEALNWNMNNEPPPYAHFVTALTEAIAVRGYYNEIEDAFEDNGEIEGVMEDVYDFEDIPTGL